MLEQWRTSEPSSTSSFTAYHHLVRCKATVPSIFFHLFFFFKVPNFSSVPPKHSIKKWNHRHKCCNALKAFYHQEYTTYAQDIGFLGQLSYWYERQNKLNHSKITVFNEISYKTKSCRTPTLGFGNDKTFFAWWSSKSKLPSGIQGIKPSLNCLFPVHARGCHTPLALQRAPANTELLNGNRNVARSPWPQLLPAEALCGPHKGPILMILLTWLRQVSLSHLIFCHG